jgi:hypothetical protein
MRRLKAGRRVEIHRSDAYQFRIGADDITSKTFSNISIRSAVAAWGIYE